MSSTSELRLTPIGLRLAVVLSHPVQYYSPWFRWLAAHAGLKLRVFYLWDFGVVPTTDPQFQTTVKWDIDLLDGYEHEFVPNRSSDPGTHHFRGLDNPGLCARISNWGADAILLFGYNWLSMQKVIWWARRRRIPLVFRGDSHLLGRGAPNLLRRLLLGAMFRQFSACLYVGQANRNYLRTLGVPEDRLHFAPHAVEGARFDPADERVLATAREYRRQLPLADRRVLLFAGKMHPRKQPVPLLRAFLQVADSRHALVFVGDGVDGPELRKIAAERPDACVRFLPFTNQSTMPAVYSMADVFCLPSEGYYETWGLAVNEAMHMGLPCIVSDLVGCQSDLVLPGRTGWVFAASDHSSLAAQVGAALTIPSAELRKMGMQAKALVDDGYNYEQAAKGLLAGLRHALGMEP